MSVEDNKVIARRFWEAFNTGNLTAMDELFDADYVHHASFGRVVRGSERVKRTIAEDRTGFPDLHFTIEDLFAEGDKVVVRLSACGTHQGTFSSPSGIGANDLLRGLPPTGKQVTFNVVDIYRITGGKIVEGWRSWDRLGLHQQLGVVPVSR
jgi:steroid delta-isomerase-like uncharacterized protein